MPRPEVPHHNLSILNPPKTKLNFISMLINLIALKHQRHKKQVRRQQQPKQEQQQQKTAVQSIFIAIHL